MALMDILKSVGHSIGDSAVESQKTRANNDEYRRRMFESGWIQEDQAPQLNPLAHLYQKQIDPTTFGMAEHHPEMLERARIKSQRDYDEKIAKLQRDQFLEDRADERDHAAGLLGNQRDYDADIAQGKRTQVLEDRAYEEIREQEKELRDRAHELEKMRLENKKPDYKTINDLIEKYFAIEESINAFKTGLYTSRKEREILTSLEGQRDLTISLLRQYGGIDIENHKESARYPIIEKPKIKDPLNIGGREIRKKGRTRSREPIGSKSGTGRVRGTQIPLSPQKAVVNSSPTENEYLPSTSP